MLIIGAKGFAKEVLEIFKQLNRNDEIYFFDDINHGIGDFLFGEFKILKDENQVKQLFKTVSPNFTIGIGDPFLRNKLYIKFISLGGIFTSTISPLANIGSYGNVIGDGCNIMTSAILTSDILIGKGVIININCTIGHDVIVGEFAEICPGVNISGHCKIGDFTFIGTNSTILPGINIGNNVIVGAGSLVNKDIPDNCIAFGVPAKIIREQTIGKIK